MKKRDLLKIPDLMLINALDRYPDLSNIYKNYEPFSDMPV